MRKVRDSFLSRFDIPNLGRLGIPVVLLVALFAACAEKTPDPWRDLPGRNAYVFHCGACHGKRGLGSKNLFPPLAGSPWANGPVDVPIRVVLQGLEGELTVNGEDYMNIMPGLGKRLNDSEVAEILTFVRSAFGNQSGPVTAADVARVRAETKDRKRMWKVPQLEPMLKGTGE